MTPNSRMMEVLSIPVIHSDSLGVAIMGVRFVVWFVVQWWCHGRDWDHGS